MSRKKRVLKHIKRLRSKNPKPLKTTGRQVTRTMTRAQRKRVRGRKSD